MRSNYETVKENLAEYIAIQRKNLYTRETDLRNNKNLSQ